MANKYMMRTFGKKPTLRSTLSIVWALLVLSGCGGGSGGSGADSAVATVSSSTFTTQRNTSGTGNFNATIPAGRTPEYRIITNGTLGTAVVTDHLNGTYQYTPNTDAVGSDFFTFKVFDGTNESGLAVVSVTILPTPSGPNNAPLAKNDVFTVTEDSTTVLAVLADNGSGPDSDADGDPLVISAVGSPGNGGTVTINGAQTGVIYTPAPNFFGMETFTYTISDGRGGSSSASVAITVSGVNDAPTAVGDIFTVPLNSTNNALYVLMDNGKGADWDIDNDSLSISAVGTPNKGGTATINVTSDALFYTPAANFAGSESFTYTIGDGNGAFSTATVTVNVAFADDFSSGMGRWSTISEGDTAASWAVVGGVLKQQNRTTGLTESYHKGTYAYFTQGTPLTNYRFSAEALFTGTGLADDIGVMFRYQNSNNYYRLSMNSRYGFTRLEKKVGGIFTTLAVNARGYGAGQTLRFTIDANGPQIQVSLNGDQLFAVNDSSLTSGSVALYAQDKASFDNVLVQGAATTPTITITTPVAHTVSTTNTINISAIATNVPAGGSVEFLLDGVNSIIDATAPYTATYNGVAQGNHTLTAIVRDAGGVELARDTNDLVGAQGDYFFTIGDSILNGSGDNYATDNQSDRILGFQGLAAGLAGMLESTAAKPIMVYNEGIGGDESVDAITRVNSILSRHTTSNKALMMLGTNDTLSQIPGGSGCTGASCDGTYKGNMQSLINTLNAAGKTVYVARISPVFGSSQSNPPYANPAGATLNTNYVQTYNSIVTSQLTGIQIGPDFYNYFLGAGQNRFSLFADIWHPNALGHAVMASLWHNALNPGSPVALPFVLDNLAPSTTAPYIKQNLLENSDIYYADASYTLTAMPTELDNGRWIMTANADWSNTSSSYITFSVDRSVTVYIAYDGGANSIPNWMSGYTNTWLTVGTTDPLSPSLRLYSRSFSAGSVTLGGNLAAGANGANSNYVAIVVPN